MFHEIHPRSFYIEYHPYTPRDHDIILSYRKGEVMFSYDGEDCLFPTFYEIKEKTQHASYLYLFCIDDTRFFTQMNHDYGYDYHPINELRTAKPTYLTYAASVGYQLWMWYTKNCFCSNCGTKNCHSQTERALQCPSCENILYPVIAPSVIVGVINGDKLLLTRYQLKHNAYRNYSLVAGYIEAGETAEQAVAREVMEEVGLRVKNIRYYKSQPWPFSSALLLGFYCDVDGSDQIILDENELSEGVWLSRKELPVPISNMSLTGEMIQRFKQNQDI